MKTLYPGKGKKDTKKIKDKGKQTEMKSALNQQSKRYCSQRFCIHNEQLQTMITTFIHTQLYYTLPMALAK